MANLAKEWAIKKALSNGRLEKLCEHRGYVTIHNKEHVAPNVFACFLIFWAATVVINIIMRTNKRFKVLSTYHQRNCITYIIEIIATTAVLVLQIVYGWNNMIYGHETTPDERKGLSYAALILTTLYTFELSYRTQTHWQLAIHHLIAIGVLMVAFFNWFDYPNASAPVVRMCDVFVLHASTEQVCFIALLLHRILDHDKHTKLIMYAHTVAAITSFIFKTAICVVTWILWVPLLYYPEENGYMWFWRYAFPILNTIMLFVQWWAASIFHGLATRFSRHKTILLRGKPWHEAGDAFLVSG